MRNWDPLLSEDQDQQEQRSLSLNYPQTQKRSATIINAEAGPSKPSGQHQCEWERDWNDVQTLAKFIGIPPKSVKLVDFTKEYWSQVFEPAVRVWEQGGTPNPDIACNR